jgi:hypothetical protein
MSIGLVSLPTSAAILFILALGGLSETNKRKTRRVVWHCGHQRGHWHHIWPWYHNWFPDPDLRRGGISYRILHRQQTQMTGCHSWWRRCTAVGLAAVFIGFSAGLR